MQAVRIIFLLLMLLTALYVTPQQLTFKTYTVSDGLVANPVRCIYQDSKGFIWIGTYEGISRYDGYKFTNYSTINGLSHNVINSILEIDNKLFVGENNGAVDVFSNSTTMEKGFTLNSAANFITSYKNRILVTTDFNGFYEYKNGNFILPPQTETTLSLGHFISYNDSLLIVDGVDDELLVYTNDLKIFAQIKNTGLHYFSLYKDSKKRIWACTSDGLKLLQLSFTKQKPFADVSLPSPFDIEILRTSLITSIAEEKDGSFWIGTLKGLIHLFPDGNYYLYNEKDGLPSARIQCLYMDKEKNLWIGTSLGLVKWVSNNHVVYYNTETYDFRNDVITLTQSGDQQIYLRTDHGLQEFDFNRKVFKNIQVPGNNYPVLVSGTSPQLIHYADWLGVLNNEKNRILPYIRLDTLLNGVVYAHKLPQGNILLETFSGLYWIKNSSIKKIITTRITSLTIGGNGDIWVATWSDGLFRIVIKNNGDGYDVYNMTEHLKEKQIRGLFTDSKNNIWVGTRYNGVFCFTLKSNGNFDIQHFTRHSGLMSDWVSSFAETKTGDIWVGTYLGLDKLVKDSSGYRVFNFSKAVNFFAEIKKIVPVRDHWICVANTGIAIFKDENLHLAPPLQSTIFSASLGVLENKITLFSPAEKITLKPFQNAARFEFGALGFANEKQELYSYRLKGSSDTSWSKPENTHEAIYASLSPGNYTFEVRTLGWNGQFGKPAVFNFTIAIPFWKQWWFIGLCAVLVAAMVYALYRYRIKQIMRLQKVRNTIATDLHDDIGSALTNISILAELSRNKNQQGAFAENLPGRISEESTLAQQALDDIIWSVNSNNDNLNQTMARMRRYAAEVFEPVGINCKIDFESIPGDYKLNMEQRKDIYLVFKECINNIIKHADAKNTFIKIDLDKGLFKLKIEDDGKGFDPLKDTDRNGVKNIRTRIERWNGKLTINSTPGKGTTVDCSFPLASLK